MSVPRSNEWLHRRTAIAIDLAKRPSVSVCSGSDNRHREALVERGLWVRGCWVRSACGSPNPSHDPRVALRPLPPDPRARVHHQTLKTLESAFARRRFDGIRPQGRWIQVESPAERVEPVAIAGACLPDVHATQTTHASKGRWPHLQIEPGQTPQCPTDSDGRISEPGLASPNR